MNDLIEKQLAPPGAVAPPEIDLNKLWDINVDSEIWQDTGLLDEEDADQGPPEWLCNENVRKGIRAMLEVDRCEEELARLAKERSSLQDWLREEWAVNRVAITDYGEISTMHHYPSNVSNNSRAAWCCLSATDATK
jgi:hypothetical protein